MQLKSLELFGFKSFADRKKFMFDKGITAIVGPNGCGKSNVVDALRWVLGEQKIKNLRSEKMENIIFNGSAKRKRSQFCEVTLTFENTKNILPTEYTVVAVTRKYYRDGESQYFINGVSCRMKDIHNLFLDTGIGSDSYAIIELKMVDQLLNDDENSRRKLFEEAAGISKYKIRKKQTIRKLDETQLDLDRVEDVLYEIEKNLKTLENQAKKAKKYFLLKEKYKDISSQFAFFKVRGIRSKLDGFKQEEKKLDDQLLQIQSAIAKLEARSLELKKEQVMNEERLQDSQKDLNQHVEKIQRIETEKSIRNERLKFLQQREFAIQDQLEKEKTQREKLHEAIQILTVKISDTHKKYTTDEKKLDKAQNELETLKAENENLKEKATKDATALREVEQQMLSLQKEIEIKQIQIQGFRNEIQRNEKDKSLKSDELDSFSPKLEELGKSLAILEKEVKKLREKKEQNETNRNQSADKINQLKDNNYKTTRLLDAKRNEFDLIKSLVENLEGFPESVKFLKKEAEWVKDAPLLSDVFNTSEKYKVAFENLLKPYLNYFIVSSRTEAHAAVKLLENATKGMANFFILDELQEYDSVRTEQIPGAIPALELVEVSEKYQKLAEFLFSKVVVVSSEKEIPATLPKEVTIIAESGNLAAEKFTLSGGSIGLFQGKRLGRAKNLEKLEKDIKNLDIKLTGEKKELVKEEALLEKYKAENPSHLLEKTNQEYQKQKQQFSILETREKEYKDFILKAGERSGVINEQISELQEALTQALPKVESLNREFADLSKLAAQSKESFELSSKVVSENSQSFNQLNIAFIQLKNLLENQNKDRVLKEDELKKLNLSEVQGQKDLEKTRQDIHNLVSNTLQNDEEIIALYEVKKEKEKQVEKFEQVAAGIRNSVSQVDEKIKVERKLKEGKETERLSSRDKLTELRIETSSLTERMKVEFGVDITQLSEAVLFEKGIDQYNAEEIEKEMMKVRTKIQSYGAINPMAVEAYDEMKERYDFINTQKKDLLEARENLKQTIKEIDNIAIQKFKDSFEQIRENFQQIFQNLFHEGDACDLFLEKPDEPLDSRIKIMAKPKGKKPLTINQLSGGEKTLTAISLLFAIYLLKPAPFCVFDEVDAPLDDANIDKFNQILNQFANESQFIIVTHNKRTMENSQVMYGITNKGDGVSMIVPANMVIPELN